MILAWMLLAMDAWMELTDNEEYFEHCFTKDDSGLKCNFCPGIYKREGHLRNHLKTKHNRSVACKCGKYFADSTRLNEHKKSCN